MTDQEAKAEAEKIIQEFYEQIPEKVFETSLNYNTLHGLSKKCAIIHVKGLKEEALLFGTRDRWEKWKAILTQLENR